MSERKTKSMSTEMRLNSKEDQIFGDEDARGDHTDYNVASREDKLISQVMCIHINSSSLVICYIGEISVGIRHRQRPPVLYCIK